MSLGAIVHGMQHVKVLKAHQLVYLRLADHATESGLSWPSHSLLARETGYTREYVIRVMQDLLQQGEIREVFDPKGRRRYQVPVYDFKRKCCGCEQPDLGCELSSQFPNETGSLADRNCELSSGGVNSTPANSSPANENPAEPLKEEPETTHARTREAEDDDWRRRYDAEQEANRPVVPPPWGPTPDTPSPPSGRPRGDQGLTSAQLAERKAFLQRQAAELAQQAAERRSPEHPEGVR